MTKLSINVNKIALLRNSRGGDYPNVLDFSQQALDYGADGITVHPRPDERHICYDDVEDLKVLIASYTDKELNVEGYPSSDFIDLICEVKPDQVTFVPDPPEALTSSFGWDINDNKAFLTSVIEQVHVAGVRSSLFIDPCFSDLDSLVSTKTDRIELYTGPYASDYQFDAKKAVLPYSNLAQKLSSTSIHINAGHDLNLLNTAFFLTHVSGVQEVSIGHAVICDALMFGWEDVIHKYRCLVT
ncbi:pyridoxine 5'-phosphate synthase [bacterium]|nr:pyridoxine 5'-phosphate synthase [bacterium]